MSHHRGQRGNGAGHAKEKEPSSTSEEACEVIPVQPNSLDMLRLPVDRVLNISTELPKPKDPKLPEPKDPQSEMLHEECPAFQRHMESGVLAKYRCDAPVEDRVAFDPGAL